jgi:hypothetical protein
VLTKAEQEAQDKHSFHNYRAFVLEHSAAPIAIVSAATPIGKPGASGSAPAAAAAKGRLETKVAAASPIASSASGGFEALSDVLEQINALTLTLEEQLQRRWHDQNAAVLASVDGVQEKLREFEENKKQWLAKAKKYMAYPAATDRGKLEAADKKLRVKKHVLELQRFDVDSTLQQLQLSRELAVLKPLAGAVTAYRDFFAAGQAALAPLAKRVDELEKYVKQREEAVEKETAALRTARRLWEKKMHKQADAAATAAAASAGSGGAATGTGIRDLDQARGKPSTTAREKEGYLFTPAPAFAMIWVALKDKTLTVQRPGPVRCARLSRFV